MKNTLNSARLAVLPLALSSAFASLAFAQTTPALPETVVTATRVATRADQLTSEVIVVDREAIERSAGRTLPEVLARTASVQMTSNGGRGKTAGVFIRGTESRHTILLIDGVRYGSATAGTPVWDNIPVDMIERIEVLKGPASALYGPDAAGGVVQIFTRRGTQGFRPAARAAQARPSSGGVLTRRHWPMVLGATPSTSAARRSDRPMWVSQASNWAGVTWRWRGRCRSR